MVGPPGAGKILLARAMPGILSGMLINEALDVTRNYTVAENDTIQSIHLAEALQYRSRLMVG